MLRSVTISTFPPSRGPNAGASASGVSESRSPPTIRIGTEAASETSGNARRALARRGPVEADVVGLREAADRQPLRARERLEGVRWLAQIGNLRIVEARDRQVGAAREVRPRRAGVWFHESACPASRSSGTSSPASAARIDASSSRNTTGSEAESWTMSTSARGSTRTSSGLVSASLRAPGHRRRADPRQQRRQPRHRARSDGLERDPRGLPRGRVPRVGAAPRVRRVEHDRVQHRGVAGDEVLHEVGAVGVAVEVDLAQPQGAQDRGEIVGRVGGGEEIACAAAVARVDLPRAAPRTARERAARRAAGEALHALAVDQRRVARAAVVDEQQTALAQQLAPVDPAVLDAAAGRRVARAALDGDQRRPGGAAAVPAEGDADAATRRPRGVERPRRASRTTLARSCEASSTRRAAWRPAPAGRARRRGARQGRRSGASSPDRMAYGSSFMFGSPPTRPVFARVHDPPRGAPPLYARRKQLRRASWPQ